LKLFDILKTLLVEKKTGVLTIQGKQAGEICLEVEISFIPRPLIAREKKPF